MIEWVKENSTMIFMVFSGIMVSIAVSENHSPKIAFARVMSGLFCAVAFPDLFLHFFSLDAEIYGNATAGLFAMVGYSLARMFANIDTKTILNIIAAVKGKK